VFGKDTLYFKHQVYLHAFADKHGNISATTFPSDIAVQNALNEARIHPIMSVIAGVIPEKNELLNRKWSSLEKIPGIRKGRESEVADTIVKRGKTVHLAKRKIYAAPLKFIPTISK
jgi:DNA-directed RNA polymerase sigma subunit (sigma70/sigma32)